VPTNTYDVLVLGDDLGGLIAAALCARRGLRVLVTETAATPVERVQVGPWSLPRAPLTFVGETSPAVRRVIAELNFIQTMKRRLQPVRPAFQVVLPDGRIEVQGDAEPLSHELSRELPNEQSTLEGFLGRAAEVSRVLEPVLGQDVSFPPEGFWEKREIARNEGRLPSADEDLLPGLPQGSVARAFIALPAAFSLNLDPRALTPTAIARAFDLWRRGTSRLDGGRATLRQLLLEKLQTQHAGEVQLVQPAGIVTRWGRAQGISLRDRDEIIGAQHIISAGPAAELTDLFGDKPPKRLTQVARGLAPTAYRFVLHMILAEAGIPEGISPVTLCVVDPAKPLIGDNAFALHVSDPDENAQVHVAVLANVAAPGDGETLEGVLAAVRPRLLARVREVMHFSEEHTLLVWSPNQARAPEGAGEVGKLPLLPPEPLWSSQLPPVLGVSALPYDSGAKGLTCAGIQVLPGLGLEGEFTAGWCAARIVCGASGKKKDYLKDEVLLGT
jgi:hypothetical protein